jgi:ribosomal protein S18 acetylase RimI-like enzyme
MIIRKANLSDCRPIAELAMIAGEGIPAYFWKAARTTDQDLIDVGATRLASGTENFSYRNVGVAEVNQKIAGMVLAYKLPPAENGETLNDYPEFIRPLIELERCAAESYYVNMLATYPEYRGHSIGTTLMGTIPEAAIDAGCKLISIEVFEQNRGALRLYQRLGYEIAERRPAIPHACHPYTGGDVILLTKDASA